MNKQFLKTIKQFCKPGIDNGLISLEDFNELINISLEYQKRQKQKSSCESIVNSTKYLSKKDLRKRYNLKSNKTIERWVREGKLKPVILSKGVVIPTKYGSRRAGGCIRFKLDDVIAFENKHFNPLDSAYTTSEISLKGGE